MDLQTTSMIQTRAQQPQKKIFYPDGETTISERKIKELLELEKALIRCRFTEVIESGYFLSEIRKKKSFFYFLETGIHPAKGGNYVAEQTEEIGFIQYCRDRLKMSKTDVYRRIRIYEHLYLNFSHVFERWIDSDGVLPDIKRLDFLSLKDRWQHAEAEQLLESAKYLDSREWEAEKAELLEGLEEAAAQEKAEKIILQRIEKARSRSTTGGTRWESEYFRKWVATQPCVITGKSTFGEIHAAHITSRGAGGDDFLNVIPLHHEIHRFQHDQGWDKVYGRYSLTGAQLYQKAAHTLKTWLIQCDALIRQARAEQANRKKPYKEGQTP